MRHACTNPKCGRSTWEDTLCAECRDAALARVNLDKKTIAERDEVSEDRAWERQRSREAGDVITPNQAVELANAKEQQ